MFKSPLNAIPDLVTQATVAISIAVSPDAGMITSFSSLIINSELSIFVYEITSLIISW